MKRIVLSTALLLTGIIVIVIVLATDYAAATPVLISSELHVCPAGCDYASIQTAVDAASNGDIIKVATGVYTDVHARPRNDITTTGVVTQVVYISKTVTIQGGYTTTNWATPYPITQPTRLDALGRGRVLYITDNFSPTIEGISITGGNAISLGGDCPTWGCYDAGGGIYVITAATSINGCQIYSNTSAHGGGMFLLDGMTTLVNNVIEGNEAQFEGGGATLVSSQAVLTNNIIVSNMSTSSGGGLSLYSGSARLTDNVFLSNTSLYQGGGIALYFGVATLERNDFLGNTSQDYGGGLSIYAGSVKLSDNTIRGNISNGFSYKVPVGGGGIYLTDADVTFSGNTIYSNTARSVGGGIFVDDSTAVFNGNSIYSNTARNYGGGVYAYLYTETVALIANLISNNAAYTGGGVSLWGGDTILNGNAILDNVAQGQGGGIHHQSGHTAMGNNMVSGNNAASGGGLFLDYVQATLHNNILRGNTAQRGGGAYLVGQSTQLTNDVVIDNHADQGSGIYVDTSRLNSFHATIARNLGSDGIYVTGYFSDWSSSPSTVALTNSILVSHTVGISVTGGNTVALNGVLWFSTPVTASQATTAVVTIQNQHEGDPHFATDGYHLLPGSAAIDNGIDAGVGADLDGEPRPYQAPDLGADEYWPPGVLKYVYLPLVLSNR